MKLPPDGLCVCMSYVCVYVCVCGEGEARVDIPCNSSAKIDNIIEEVTFG